MVALLGSMDYSTSAHWNYGKRDFRQDFGKDLESINRVDYVSLTPYTIYYLVKRPETTSNPQIGFPLLFNANMTSFTVIVRLRLKSASQQQSRKTCDQRANQQANLVKKSFQYGLSLSVNTQTNALHATSSCQPSNIGFRNPPDCISWPSAG